MMKNFKYVVFAIFGLLFITASCSDVEERTRTLNVETDKVVLNYEAQIKTIAVEVDKGEIFVAEWTGEEWAKVEINGSSVVITIEANTTITKRTGSVEVRLDNGWRTQLIEVVQNGDNPILNIIPDHISLDFMGGEYTIEVEANAEWSIEAGATDWLEITPYLQASEIVLTMARNPLTFVRQTSFTITAGSSSKEITVGQTAALGELLPYIDFANMSIDIITEFETARYGSIIPSASPMVATRVFTESDLCPEIQYTVFGGANFMLGAVYYNVKGYPTYLVDKEYEAFFENENFEFIYINSKGYDIYWLDNGEEAAYHCMATVMAKLGVITYERKTQAQKPTAKDAPTFDAFPYMPSEITFGMSVDAVKTWEAANNGTVASETATFIMVEVTGDPEVHARLYSFAKSDKTLFRVDYLFTDKEKVYVAIGAGGITLNPRFGMLLQTEGFEHLGNDEDNRPIYRNAPKGIEISPWLGVLESSTTEYGVITFVQYIPSSGAAERADAFKGNGLITPVEMN